MITVIGAILAVPGKKVQEDTGYNVYLLDDAGKFLTDNVGNYLISEKES